MKVSNVLWVGAKYLVLRQRASRLYPTRPLDELLSALEGEQSIPLPWSDVRLGVRLAESIARRTQLDLDTCLFRALSRYALLRLVGYRVTFVLGVANEMDRAGHAWVELAGRPVFESERSGFVRAFTRASDDRVK